MRTRFMPRMAMGHQFTVDEYGRIVGSQIAPHSLPGDRIGVEVLAQIQPALGTVYSGTLYAGENQGRSGARVGIGTEVYGMRMWDAAERLWLSFDWRDQSARLGLLGTSGVDVVAGNVQIDGNCNVDGTIMAQKLVIGSAMAYTLIEAGYIFAGSGNPLDPAASNLQGWVIAPWEFAGYKDGHKCWEIDPTTNAFVTRIGAGEYEYIQIGEGQIVASGYATRDLILLRQYILLEESSELLQEIGVDLNMDGIMFYRKDALPAALLLTDSSKQLIGCSTFLGQGLLHMRNFAGDEGVTLQVPYTDASYGELWTTNAKLRIGGYNNVTRLELSPTGLFFADGPIGFQNVDGIWGDEPTSPSESMIWYDGVNHKLKIRLDGATHTFDTTAV